MSLILGTVVNQLQLIAKRVSTKYNDLRETEPSCLAFVMDHRKVSESVGRNRKCKQQPQCLFNEMKEN